MHDDRVLEDAGDVMFMGCRSRRCPRLPDHRPLLVTHRLHAR